MVVCKEISKPFLDFAAALVVEILSPSTAMKDRTNKFYIYQSQKIPYYLIVDIDKNEIEIYRLNAEGKYKREEVSTAQYYPFNLDKNCTVDILLDNIWE